jgi:O-acetyl-ADP-ribose deacetylase (regulator of RNase III)
MIQYVTGDITATLGIDELVCHGCNCSGGFGSGVAGAIRKKYPQVYEAFKNVPPSPNLLGDVQIVTINYTNKFYIANCFTQVNYGKDGKVYADINAIAQTLEQCYDIAEILELSISAPMIGCGLGGLDWEKDVKNIFESLYKKYNVQTTIYSL